MQSPTLGCATRRLAAATLAALLVGCGGGGSDDAAPAAAAGNVGPGGATLTSADGNAMLVVPAGALGTTITATLAPATPADGYTDDPQIVAGTAYKLDAPDTALAAPAALSIALPASAVAAAAARADRKHALATVPSAGFIACYLVVNTADAPEQFYFVPSGPGAELPHTDRDAFGCAFLTDYYTAGDLGNPPCPAGWDFRFMDHWEIPSYFTDDNIFTFPPNSGQGYITFCVPGADPAVSLVVLSAPKIVLGSWPTPVLLPALGHKLFGLLKDTTPPSLHLTATVVPAGPGLAKVHLQAGASDNVGVVKVDFEEEAVDSSRLAVERTFADHRTKLASFTAAPFVWESAAMPPDKIFASHHTYAVSAYDAAGNRTSVSKVFSAAAPVINSFTSSVASLPIGGGDVTLSWSVPGADSPNYADALVIDQGVGNVTGNTSKAVHVTSTTTFTLTGTNPSGSGSASVTVAVAPRPAPTITAFSATPASLPPGGGTVTLAWTTSDADTLGIDGGVGAVTGTSLVVTVAANTTFTLTATNPSGSASKQASVTVGSAGIDRYIDPAAGADTNACTQLAPCKSLAKGLSGATSGATLYLADGVYAPATQGNGATIPDGVAVRASHAGAASLVDGVTLKVAGSSAIDGIVLDSAGSFCGAISATTTVGTPTLALSGVLIKCLGALNIGGSVKATLVPGALAGGLYTAALPNSYTGILAVGDTAELLISGGVIDGNGLGAPAFGGGLMLVTGSAKLTLSGVTVKNRTGTAIAAIAKASVVLNSGTLLDTLGIGGSFACASGAAIIVSGPVTVTVDHAQISNSPNAAICVRNGSSAATIQLTQSSFTHNGAGVASETGTGSTAMVTADGASFTNNGYGIYFDGLTGSSFDLKNSTFTGNSVGLQVNVVAGSLTLRGSNLSNNSDSGAAINGGISVDLGTSASPGLNTFDLNTNTGLKTSASATVQAVGNTWSANVQGADAGGHYSIAPAYTPVSKTGPTSGKNFSIVNGGSVNF